ncbi:MAG: preprotein translocase subunit YajC [Pyrinomonadaceae bacterium]|jgi:preprotein translocase subunit YajC|nr:preprotein translocase subunit YajC [Pyrinomonadaceae bacterium]MDQ1559942.1 preprotein translocase subunit YajC [Pyrinomonadaceae bacterium]MDQ1590710.1 preprotein translocase subunit YajC [Pyrinomonadaceae bacterium]MDQ1611485.1 preprotein translocase subunit YajC [Pyrinomonadaceae bacterium]MDX6272767.1 preprotein translocase subunit YajC [Acidobacteriota bacterium]
MSLAFILQSALGPVIQILPFLLIFAVFYFLIILPQRKRQQQLQATISALKAGDKIITTGGIIAKIAEVRETSLLVRTADKSILEISRAAVAGMHGEEEKKS